MLQIWEPTRGHWPWWLFPNSSRHRTVEETAASENPGGLTSARAPRAPGQMCDWLHVEGTAASWRRLRLSLSSPDVAEAVTQPITWTVAKVSRRHACRLVQTVCSSFELSCPVSSCPRDHLGSRAGAPSKQTPACFKFGIPWSPAEPPAASPPQHEAAPPVLPNPMVIVDATVGGRVSSEDPELVATIPQDGPPAAIHAAMAPSAASSWRIRPARPQDLA